MGGIVQAPEGRVMSPATAMVRVFLSVPFMSPHLPPRRTRQPDLRRLLRLARIKTMLLSCRTMLLCKATRAKWGRFIADHPTQVAAIRKIADVLAGRRELGISAQVFSGAWLAIARVVTPGVRLCTCCPLGNSSCKTGGRGNG